MGNERRGLARFASLLRMFELENRMITNVESLTSELIKEEINWASVDTIWNKKRAESIEFLRKSLL